MATEATATQRMTIICPMRFEQSLLEHHGVGAFARMVCSGPGPKAMTRCIDDLQAADGPVVLVGVAGGLSPNVHGGQCFVVTGVRSQDDDSLLQPTLELHASGKRQSCVVCGVDEPVTTAQGKRQLHERTGHDLVDTESHVFARTCHERGLPWAVIRGVSDGAGEALPGELTRCVDAAGRPLTGRAALFAMKKPQLVPVMLRLRRNSIATMRAAADLLRAFAPLSSVDDVAM